MSGCDITMAPIERRTQGMLSSREVCVLTSEHLRGAQPRFQLVANAVSDAIARGEISDRLPTERALCEKFGVSRVTLRRALATLAENGLVAPSWGRGWYVVGEPLSEPPNALLSFTELADQMGLKASSQVLACNRRSAGMDEAETLHIAPGATVLELDRLRLLDGVPTVLQRSLLAISRLDGLPDDTEVLGLGEISLYEVLERFCGTIATRAHYVVEARAADHREAELLNIPVASPVLLTRQVTFDQRGEPFEQHWSVYPHDRYRFQATLTRPTNYERTGGVTPKVSSRATKLRNGGALPGRGG